MTGSLVLPLFVGPTLLVVGTLLAILLLLTVARLVFAIAWRIVVLAGIILLGLWLIGVFIP